MRGWTERQGIDQPHHNAEALLTHPSVDLEGTPGKLGHQCLWSSSKAPALCFHSS